MRTAFLKGFKRDLERMAEATLIILQFYTACPASAGWVCGPFPKMMNSPGAAWAAENNSLLNGFSCGSVQTSPSAGTGKQNRLCFVFPNGVHFSSTAQFLEKPLLLDSGEDTLPWTSKIE
ncbi:Pleckstrin-likey Domain-Containing Family A Member 1 [Manis pentadactyla]|nr:Pleckstrin-likey Domain-Containing Family A Member 1 [Manis pentadactyla]